MMIQQRCNVVAELHANSLSSLRAVPGIAEDLLRRRHSAQLSCSRWAYMQQITAPICSLQSEQPSSRKSEASECRSTSAANFTSGNAFTYSSHSAQEGLNLAFLGQLHVDQPKSHELDDYEIRFQIRNLVSSIKAQLSDLAVNEGVITASPYDTAWVARVSALDGSPVPQFPEALNWLLRNQLPDGSWGEGTVDVASDRLLSTLASIVALATWKSGHPQIQKGVTYLWSNINRLKETTGLLMPAGFELFIPTLMEDAKDLGLDLPLDNEVVQSLKDLGRKKREKIPLEMLYARATTLMFSLEGLKGLDIDWCRVLKLQISDGSIMASPAATAFALMETGDPKCKAYLQNLIRKFDGAVPAFYPMENYQILWTVDVLERLGISRYFADEIEAALASINRAWSDKVGMAWTRLIDLVDIDDTSMAFRMLRMHGYEVDEGVFNHFRRDGQFVCWEGQLIQGLSDMFGLHRATEIQFPGETILEEAHECSKNFLENALAVNKTNADKWSLKKDLYGEVQRRLNCPLHSVPPRLEINDYLQRYGVDDPWVAKTIYRLPLVNNESYLALASADARLCQSYYAEEVLQISEWLQISGLDTSLYETALETFLLFAADIWEPEYSPVRVVAAKSAILGIYLRQAFNSDSYTRNHDGTEGFIKALRKWDPSVASTLPNVFKTLFMALWQTVNTFTEQAFRLQGRDVSTIVRQSWERFATAVEKEREWGASSTKSVPCLEEYMDNARAALGAEPPILTSFFFADAIVDDEGLARIDCRSDFWKNSCSYARLEIELGSSEDLSFSPAFPLRCVREYAGLLPTEIYELLQSQRQDLARELNLSMWGSSSTQIPVIFRRLVVSISRIMPKISSLSGESHNSLRSGDAHYQENSQTISRHSKRREPKQPPTHTSSPNKNSVISL